MQGTALDFVPAKEGVQRRHGRKPVAAVDVAIQARRKAILGLANHIIRFLAALVYRKDEVGLPRIVQVLLDDMRRRLHEVWVCRARGTA